MTLTWPTKYEMKGMNERNKTFHVRRHLSNAKYETKCLLKNDLITDEQTNFSP